MYANAMRHLYSCTADVLRLQEQKNEAGFIIGITYVKIATIVDSIHGIAGEMKCRLDLAIVRKGSAVATQSAQGSATNRFGTLICDVTDNLYAGDRIRMKAGSGVIGTFEIKARPDIVSSPFGSGHMEVDVLEVTKPGNSAAGSFVPEAAMSPSGMRHLYNTRVSVMRPDSVSGIYQKITEIPDVTLNVSGELMCHLAIGVVRQGREAQLPIAAGRAPDRVGVMICDNTQHIMADDRLLVISGPNLGTFEIRRAPDMMQGFASAYHMEVEVVEVVKSIKARLS